MNNVCGGPHFNIPIDTAIVVPPSAFGRQIVPWLAINRVIILIGLIVPKFLGHSVENIFNHNSLKTNEHHVNHHEQAALSGLINPGETVV